jgi:NAD(P)-dependent dehydrogenase (short-subunit alcohol dehydrogenase family)
MLKDKVIVVTGGAGLIGQAFVEAIVKEGGLAIIADIHPENGEKVRAELSIKLKTQSIDFFKTNITSVTSLEALITYIQTKYSRIDALVNNAYPRNKSYGKAFFDVTYDSFCENLNSHLGGYFLASQQFGQFFKKQGIGNIVNMSSIYGLVAPRFELYEETSMTMPVEYAVIKSAIIHFTKYLAVTFKGLSIRANCISPGGIEDHQNPEFLKRYQSHCLSKGMLDPKDIVGTLLFLLSDQSQLINGQNIIVDDGFTL